MMSPTFRLRWVERPHKGTSFFEYVLQQWFQEEPTEGDLIAFIVGDAKAPRGEWRDVPLETE